MRERASRTEELRRLPDETIADLHRAGLFRILQPKRVGGSELPFRALVELVAIIARGDASTGWVLANLAAHHWLFGMWPKQAQDEIRGASPDNLIGSALIFPRGRAPTVEGGYRLTGRWPFSSGVDAASWNMIGGIVQDEEAAPRAPRIFLLPTSDYTVIDTWQVIGLAGTGSKDVVAEDVFVPGYRSLAIGPDRRRPQPGQRGEPVGALPAAGDQPVRLLHRRRFARYRPGRDRAFHRDDPHPAQHLYRAQPRRFQHGAGASGRGGGDGRRGAGDHARRLRLGDGERRRGPALELGERARYRRDGAFAATLCTKAVDVLFTATGGGAIYARNPMQRAFRDVHAAYAHYVLNWDINGATNGRVALGLPPDAPL